MTRILLVRHGESEWNQSGRWQGQADPPLTERGRRQSAHAAHNLGDVDAIASSDLERALDTARIIATALGLGPVQCEPGLRERDVGEWSGLTRAEIHRQWPGYLADDPRTARRDGAEQRRPPGWEGDHVLLSRVRQALRSIADRSPDGEVLAVTHGGVVYGLEMHFGGDAGRLDNLHGRWVDVEGERLTLGDRAALVSADETVAIERDRI